MNPARDLEGEPVTPAYRVRWGEIHDYARRFSEYAIVRAIAPKAQRIDVPIERLGAALTPPRKVRFGPLESGAALVTGWRTGELRAAGERVRIELVREGDGASAWLSLYAPESAGPSGPFDVGGVRIAYERTPLPFAAFEPAGRELARRLGVALEGGSATALFKAWRDALGSQKVRTHKLPDTEALEIRPDGKVYLRITDSCQERCVFCFFYDTDEIDNLVRHHELGELVEQLDPTGIQQVILTGGEPTLNPRLPEYVGTLHRRGFKEIILQTNGVKLAEPGWLEQLLPYRDRLGIGFSLHAATEDANDRLTTVAKGFFPRKIEGLRRASALGFRTKITLVLNRMNLPELVPFVELCRDVTGTSDTFVQFSLPSFEGRMNLFLDTYPRLEEIAAHAPAAFRRARELDLKVALCHQCQVPPCVVPDDVQHLESMWFADTPAMWSHDRAYGPQCGGCALRPRCSGVWKGYADQFGLAALKPFGPGEVEPFELSPEPLPDRNG